MTLELLQQTGMSLINQPFAATQQFTVQAAGRSIVVVDSNGQKIFPGHSKYINAVCARDNIMASSQDGCICIWDQQGQARVIPTPESARWLDFSLDSKFLAVTYMSGLTECYECASLLKIGQFTGHKRAQSCYFVAWGQCDKQNLFITSDHNRINMHMVVYDRATLQYGLKSEAISLPASGLDREFTCGAVSYPYCYCGTPSGEVGVFNLQSKCFRQILRYFQGKVQNIIVLNSDTIAISSQKGDLLTLAGKDINLQVSSEALLDCGIAFIQSRPGTLFVVGLNGSVITFSLIGQQIGEKVEHVQSHADFNRDGHQNLPGQANYLKTTPHDRQTRAQESSTGFVAFSIDLNSLQVIQAFPVAPFVETAILTDNNTEILIGGTESGFVQAWDRGVLLGQFKSSGRCGGLCCVGNLIYTAFDNFLHIFEWQNGFVLKNKIPVAAMSSIACSEQLLACGCTDGKIFIFDSQTYQIISKITDYGSPVTAILFDLVVPHILHVANQQGFITAYDLMHNCQRLKHRQTGSSITNMSQINDGRYEIVTSNLDGTIRFFDFDVQDPVQIVKMPPGCVIKGKLFVDVHGDRLIAGGCYMDADEVLLCMRMGQSGWEPAGSQLTNGIQIGSLKIKNNIYVSGIGGELAVYEWI
ncbi:WD40_repeat protein [Hexamita inflata]|uniref:Cilia- and flagella-associated protein 52 n=2 Tax=Hexamita inflata TaxID=28002 RepID=A0AA86PZP2_9EUKA|nr:WD40 repeat protein [Hexamita inflata]